jgi:hypothetical protein
MKPCQSKKKKERTQERERKRNKWQDQSPGKQTAQKRWVGGSPKGKETTKN